MRTSSVLASLVALAPLVACWSGCTPNARRPASSSESVAVTAVKGGRAEAAGEGPSREEIPVHDVASKSKRCECSWPVFDHPDPVARAALAAKVAEDVSLARDDASNAMLTCSVSVATRSVVSFVCFSMVSSTSDEDAAQGIGGAPAEDTIESFTYLIDGSAVRRATFDDVFASFARASAALPALARKTLEDDDDELLKACPKWKLPALAGDTSFTVAEGGLTLHFMHSHYPTDPDVELACMPRAIRISFENLRPWLREDGVIRRVPLSDTP